MSANKIEVVNQVLAAIDKIEKECEHVNQEEPRNSTEEAFEEIRQEAAAKLSQLDVLDTQLKSAFAELKANQKQWKDYSSRYPSNQQEAYRSIINSCQDMMRKHISDMKKKMDESAERRIFGRNRSLSTSSRRQICFGKDTTQFAKDVNRTTDYEDQQRTEDSFLNESVEQKNGVATSSGIQEDGTILSAVLDQISQIRELFSTFGQISTENQQIVLMLAKQMCNDRSDPEANQPRSYPRLRELPFPTFSGERPQDFWIWMEEFNNCVGRRNDIDESVKLHYLKEALRNPARYVMDGLALKGENYSYVLRELEKKYGDSDVIEEASLDRLKKIGATQCEPDATAMGKVYHEQKSIVRSLAEKGQVGRLHIQLLRSAYPWNLMEKVIERETNFKEEYGRSWSAQELLEAIRQSIKVVEMKEKYARKQEDEPSVYRLHYVQDGNQEHTQREQRCQQPAFRRQQMNYRSNQQQPACQSRNFRSNQNFDRPRSFKCGACDREGHAISQCQQYQTLEERQKVVADKNCCRKCFSSIHQADVCGAYDCKRCQGKHNIALCPQSYFNGHYQLLREPARYQPEVGTFREEYRMLPYDEL